MRSVTHPARKREREGVGELGVGELVVSELVVGELGVR